MRLISQKRHLYHAHEQAAEWLADCQTYELLLRFKAGKKVALKLRGETTAEATKFLTRPRNVQQDLLDIERKMIRENISRG